MLFSVFPSLLRYTSQRILLELDVTLLKTDVSVLKNDVSEMKEDLEITRVAANYNGEKLEELAEELKKMNVIS